MRRRGLGWKDAANTSYLVPGRHVVGSKAQPTRTSTATGASTHDACRKETKELQYNVLVLLGLGSPVHEPVVHMQLVATGKKEWKQVDSSETRIIPNGEGRTVLNCHT